MRVENILLGFVHYQTVSIEPDLKDNFVSFSFKRCFLVEKISECDFVGAKLVGSLINIWTRGVLYGRSKTLASARHSAIVPEKIQHARVCNDQPF